MSIIGRFIQNMIYCIQVNCWYPHITESEKVKAHPYIFAPSLITWSIVYTHTTRFRDNRGVVWCCYVKIAERLTISLRLPIIWYTFSKFGQENVIGQTNGRMWHMWVDHISITLIFFGHCWLLLGQSGIVLMLQSHCHVLAATFSHGAKRGRTWLQCEYTWNNVATTR
jgi:hypothetical protein